jgi:hypothetical protein
MSVSGKPTIPTIPTELNIAVGGKTTIEAACAAVAEYSCPLQGKRGI